MWDLRNLAVKLYWCQFEAEFWAPIREAIPQIVALLQHDGINIQSTSTEALSKLSKQCKMFIIHLALIVMLITFWSWVPGLNCGGNAKDCCPSPAQWQYYQKDWCKHIVRTVWTMWVIVRCLQSACKTMLINLKLSFRHRLRRQCHRLLPSCSTMMGKPDVLVQMHCQNCLNIVRSQQSAWKAMLISIWSCVSGTNWGGNATDCCSPPGQEWVYPRYGCWCIVKTVWTMWDLSNFLERPC